MLQGGPSILPLPEGEQRYWESSGLGCHSGMVSEVLRLEDLIHEDDEFAHHGDQRDLRFFAGGPQALIEHLELALAASAASFACGSTTPPSKAP